MHPVARDAARTGARCGAGGAAAADAAARRSDDQGPPQRGSAGSGARRGDNGIGGNGVAGSGWVPARWAGPARGSGGGPQVERAAAGVDRAAMGEAAADPLGPDRVRQRLQAPAYAERAGIAEREPVTRAAAGDGAGLSGAVRRSGGGAGDREFSAAAAAWVRGGGNRSGAGRGDGDERRGGSADF